MKERVVNTLADATLWVAIRVLGTVLKVMHIMQGGKT